MDLKTEEHYKQKISLINGIDPYKLDVKDVSSNPEDFPSINLWTLGCYLVYKTSYYTEADMKNYQSLDAFTLFAGGWMREVYVKVINDWHVVIGKVMTPMQLSETPLQSWIIADKNGVINSAHCTCMAGLGEACIHVAALLFYIERYSRNVEEKKREITNAKSYPTPLTAVEKVPIAPIDEIDFSNKRLCDKEIETQPKRMRKTSMTDEDVREFLDKLAAIETPTPIRILLTTPPYCYKYANSRNKRH